MSHEHAGAIRRFIRLLCAFSCLFYREGGKLIVTGQIVCLLVRQSCIRNGKEPPLEQEYVRNGKLAVCIQVTPGACMCSSDKNRVIHATAGHPVCAQQNPFALSKCFAVDHIGYIIACLCGQRCVCPIGQPVRHRGDSLIQKHVGGNICPPAVNVARSPLVFLASQAVSTPSAPSSSFGREAKVKSLSP